MNEDGFRMIQPARKYPWEGGKSRADDFRHPLIASGFQQKKRQAVPWGRDNLRDRVYLSLFRLSLQKVEWCTEKKIC